MRAGASPSESGDDPRVRAGASRDADAGMLPSGCSRRTQNFLPAPAAFPAGVEAPFALPRLLLLPCREQHTAACCFIYPRQERLALETTN